MSFSLVCNSFTFAGFSVKAAASIVLTRAALFVTITSRAEFSDLNRTAWGSRNGWMSKKGKSQSILMLKDVASHPNIIQTAHLNFQLGIIVSLSQFHNLLIITVFQMMLQIFHTMFLEVVNLE